MINRNSEVERRYYAKRVTRRGFAHGLYVASAVTALTGLVMTGEAIPEITGQVTRLSKAYPVPNVPSDETYIASKNLEYQADEQISDAVRRGDTSTTVVFDIGNAKARKEVLDYHDKEAARIQATVDVQTQTGVADRLVGAVTSFIGGSLVGALAHALDTDIETRARNPKEKPLSTPSSQSA